MSINNIIAIKPLNDAEKSALRVALQHYITTHNKREIWAQQVILDEMLDKLMWANCKPEGVNS